MSVLLCILILFFIIFSKQQMVFAMSTIYQAEDAVMSQAITETVNSGYTGPSYVNYNNEIGSYVEWTVNVTTAETEYLVFTYANGTTVDRPMEIRVNGNVVMKQLTFASTGAWTTWNTVVVQVMLNAGNNTIRATATTSNGGPNVDKLEIVRKSEFPTYQAEDAVLSQAVTETINTGYTGASYVNYDSSAGGYVEWTVHSDVKGTATLVFTYANGTTVDRPMDITVNGSVINSLSFLPTGSWTTWLCSSIEIPLKVGSNVIRATAITSDGGPNVDKINLSTVATPKNVYKFDFGAGSAISGYTKVNASLAYSSSLGYGFHTSGNMSNVSASGTGINADAVQFLTYGVNSSNTFNIDVPNGLYEIKVTLGNTARASVAAEGVYQIMNLTGNCVSDTIQIPITDGQLNLLVTEGKAGTAFTLSALEITWLSADPTMAKTIWIGGDSTACNYYPLASSNQTGWGQIMSTFVSNANYQIRNISTGGQYARGFRDYGQFTAIMKYIKPGDIFLLDFGINDTADKNNETEAEFKEIMRDMVRQVEAKGATVVLVTPQGKTTDWVNGVHLATAKWYRPATVALASEANVPLVDLNVISSAYYTSIGETATTSLYMADGLHLNHNGATVLARLVTAELKNQNLLLD